MVFENMYDTDSIEYDLLNENESNIGDKIESSELYKKCQLILSKNKFKNSSLSRIYSQGIRYFQWKFYQNNKNKYNVLATNKYGGVVKEKNVGYKFCDWYIIGVYNNLKEELLNNKLATFSINEWQTTQQKSILKLNAKQKIYCIENDPLQIKYREKFYGISSDDSISVEHIMSILFYCNFTENCRKLSETFRKKIYYETDESLKKRHSQFYN